MESIPPAETLEEILNVIRKMAGEIPDGEALLGRLDRLAEAVQAEQAAVTKTIADRYHQLERRLAELAAVQEVASVVNRNLEIEALLVEVVEQIRRVLGYQVVEVYLVEGDELVQRSALQVGGMDSLRLPLSRGIIGRVARTNQPAFVKRVREDPDYVEGIPGSLSEIAVPLRKGELVIGVLNVESADPEGLTEEDLRLLALLADQLSVAIENAALYERLRKHRDDLEGAVARRTAELAMALEEARQANRVKARFVNDVSHELRTPLSNIKLYLDLLEHGSPDRTGSYLETLQRETDRLVLLIEDMLTVSQLDSEKRSIDGEALDLNAIARTLVEDRQQLFAERGLSLILHAEPGLPLIMGESHLISRAIANLLNNAMNYSQRGGAVTLETQCIPGDTASWVQLAVSDTGLGLDSDDKSRLFERFFRGSASRKVGSPGTGLGLAIVKDILERHHGEVIYQPGESSGSRFMLRLPALSEPTASDRARSST